MPRGFSAWGQKRRPEAKLFQSRGYASEPVDPPPSDKVSPEPFTHDGFTLDHLIDSLMDDGELGVLNLDSPKEMGSVVGPSGQIPSLLLPAASPPAFEAPSSMMPVDSHMSQSLDDGSMRMCGHPSANMTVNACPMGAGSIDDGSMRTQDGGAGCLGSNSAPSYHMNSANMPTTSREPAVHGQAFEWNPLKGDSIMASEPMHLKQPMIFTGRANSSTSTAEQAHLNATASFSKTGSANPTSLPIEAAPASSGDFIPTGWSPESELPGAAPSRSNSGSTSQTPTHGEQQEFLWQESPCLLERDAHGTSIAPSPEMAAAMGQMAILVELEQPLLYWSERRQWMWHKKWCLPQFTVRATCDAIHVDARKRTKCERPDAQAGDVRLVQRRAGVAPSAHRLGPSAHARLLRARGVQKAIHPETGWEQTTMGALLLCLLPP
ncbi:MAG: hypothetical protein SGPRY_009289 [Prymnesium sp.]